MFWRKKKLKLDWNYHLSLSTPIEELSFTVFDTEATGFNISSRDRLIEIGAVQVIGFEVIENTFQTYINPKIQIPQEIVQLTGIDQHKVAEAPEAIVAIQSFFRFVENNQSVAWVGHFIPFDTMAIKGELKRAQHTFEKPHSIDTLDLLQFLKPNLQAKDLEEYTQDFSTPIFSRHTALGDALSTAHLFCSLLKTYKERGNRTWGDLLYAIQYQQRHVVMS